MTGAGGPRAAQRRRRADARQRILAAARAALEQRPWSEVTLEEVMRAAGLTRTAFYRHFEDRQLLLVALVDELELGFDAVAAPWIALDGQEDPEAALGRALRALVEIYAEHGRLMQALADGAVHDPDVRATYLALGERLVALSTAAIEREVAAGRSTLADPAGVARALVWMNERYLSLAFGRPPLADPDHAAETLAEVWRRTVYGTPDTGSLDPSGSVAQVERQNSAD